MKLTDIIWLFALAAVVVIVGTLLLPRSAHAKMSGLTVAERQELRNLSPGERAARDTFFRDLKTPNGSSCCSLADCHFTEAEYHDGQWWAHIPFDSAKWVPIPPDKVVKGKVSPSEDGKAIVCYSLDPAHPIVYCFVEGPNGY